MRDGTRAFLPEYKEDEYAALVQEAIDVFRGQTNREWLAWGSGLMVGLWKEVDDEAEAKRLADEVATREAEAREREANEARKEAEAKEARERMVAGWMDEAQAGKLDWAEVGRRVKAVDDGEDWESKEVEGGEGKDVESVVGGDDVVVSERFRISRVGPNGPKKSTFGPGRMKMSVEIPVAPGHGKKRGVDEGKPVKVRDPIAFDFHELISFLVRLLRYFEAGRYGVRHRGGRSGLRKMSGEEDKVLVGRKGAVRR